MLYSIILKLYQTHYKGTSSNFRFLFIKAEFHFLHTVFDGDFLQVCPRRSHFISCCPVTRIWTLNASVIVCVHACVCKNWGEKITYLTTKLSITCFNVMVLFVIKDADKHTTVDFRNQQEAQIFKECRCLLMCLLEMCSFKANPHLL